MEVTEEDLQEMTGEACTEDGDDLNDKRVAVAAFAEKEIKLWNSYTINT